MSLNREPGHPSRGARAQHSSDGGNLMEVVAMVHEREEPRKACACPDHPGCHRTVPAGRNYCSTCRNFCGPFGGPQ